MYTPGMEHTKAQPDGAGGGGTTIPLKPGIRKKARCADGDLEDIVTDILGLPADVMVTTFGLLDLKTLVMVIPSVSSNPRSPPTTGPPIPAA